MSLKIKYKILCAPLWENSKKLRLERTNIVIKFIEDTHHTKVDKAEFSKIENFVKIFEKNMLTVRGSVPKFQSKFDTWLESSIEININTSLTGAPYKQYDDLGPKSKKNRILQTLSSHSSTEVTDTFKEMLKKNKQPMEAMKIADILPSASPKKLRRIAKCIPTPTSGNDFTDEEAIALMLELGLSRNKYNILRKALMEKGFNILPSYTSIKTNKQNILPHPIAVNDQEACIELANLLENTATRIVSGFSTDQLNKVNNSDVVMLCKWGCDGLSSLPEYKQAGQIQSSSGYKSVFMASLVPLRIRLYSKSCENAFEDIWINPTPGSKLFCRPIGFEYTKESTTSTKDLVAYINGEKDNLEPISIEIGTFRFNISFDLKLTMIDGKVSNAITDTSSFWKCSICNENKSQFSDIFKERTINEEVLSYGISPLHCRIRFMEHFLHIAYDLKYRSIPENANKPVKSNEELTKVRESEKKRIQEQFKIQTGLVIDKPLPSGGSTNDGNTSRRFFRDFEVTSAITGLDKELLRKVNIVLMALNSKHKVNGTKFGKYADDISKTLITLYPWRDITPTVHKVLCHGQIIIESHILPLGELTEEAQEARNRDFKHVHLFSSRKCSRISQNEDIFNSLLLSSDPVLALMRKRWISYDTSENQEEYKDLLYLLDMYDDISDWFLQID